MAVRGRKDVLRLLRDTLLGADPVVRAGVGQDKCAQTNLRPRIRSTCASTEAGVANPVLVEFERPGEARSDVGEINPRMLAHSGLLASVQSARRGPLG